jgi:HSP20 family molecular chaperone IbpA
MAFFPRDLYTANNGFTPLFRFLDDFDNFQKQHHGGRHHKGHLPTFQPKFDVRELDGAYELHGELAGLSKKDVHIEFTDPQTVVVRGHVERTYTEGAPPAGLIEDTQMSGAITEKGEEQPAAKKGYQPTVEDESTAGEPTPATTANGDLAAKQQQEQPQKDGKKKAADKAKYWVSERSVGDFSRTFSFPSRIDQEGVTAKLEDGILTVRVPKAPKHEARRIAIE